MNILEKILAVLLLVALVGLAVQTGRVSASQHAHEKDKAAWALQVKEAQLKANQQAFAQSEAARETERIANIANQKVIDEHQRREADIARALTATTRKLRDAESAYLAAASEKDRATAAECRTLDAPAVAVLSDETRSDLVQLARDAESTAERLRALQRYLDEVIAPVVWTKN